MNEEELTPVTVTVTCQTADCENTGIPITITTVEGAQVVCGPCGAELHAIIEDVTDNKG